MENYPAIAVEDKEYQLLRWSVKKILNVLGVATDPLSTDFDIVNGLRNRMGLPNDQKVLGDKDDPSSFKTELINVVEHCGEALPDSPEPLDILAGLESAATAYI